MSIFIPVFITSTESLRTVADLNENGLLNEEMLYLDHQPSRSIHIKPFCSFIIYSLQNQGEDSPSSIHLRFW